MADQDANMAASAGNIPGRNVPASLNLLPRAPLGPPSPGGYGTTSPGSSQGQLLNYRNVCEPTDSKEYISMLHPENHLPIVKSYETMTYRDLVLGMAGIHSHLVHAGRPTAGFDAHCLFIKRKAASFLYTNLANILYNRFVTNKVISGEYVDFPSSCGDAMLEFYCDSYRVEHGVNNSHNSGKSPAKPWSGYPYPFCFFWNERSTCCKRNCSLRHECGYCHTSEHKSQNCSKSNWQKSKGDGLDQRGKEEA